MEVWEGFTLFLPKPRLSLAERPLLSSTAAVLLKEGMALDCVSVLRKGKTGMTQF